MLHLTIGVDLRDGATAVYVADTSSVSLQGIQGAGRGSAEMSIRSLADVNVSGTVNLNATATLSLHDLDADHKIRTADFRDHPATVVTGRVDGSVVFSDVAFAADLLVGPALKWTGRFEVDIANNQLQPQAPQLVTPRFDDFLKGLAQGFFSGKNVFNPLASLSDMLSKKLPLINRSIADEIDMASGLGWLAKVLTPTDSDLSPGQIRDTLSRYGIQVDATPSSLLAAVRGEKVDLLHYEAQGGQDLPILNWHQTLYTLGYPELLSANLEASVSIDAGWSYHVGLGIDTTGFWIKEGSGLSARFDARAGIEGNVKVFS